MRPSFILEECGQKQRRAGYQTIIIISPYICVGSSNERHWGRNMGRWEEFKKGNFTNTWNQCKKIMRKLVKSFTSWVKTCMVEKHAHQQICRLHPIDPKNKFSAWKKICQYTFFQVSKPVPTAKKHVHVCLIARHGASKISLWAYKRPGV